MNALLIVMGVAGMALLVLGVGYCWKNRPYRARGDEWRDEAAMEASTFVNRSGTGGL